MIRRPNRWGGEGGFKEAEHVAAAGQLERGQHEHKHMHACVSVCVCICRECGAFKKTLLLFASLSAIFPQHQMVVLRGTSEDAMLLAGKERCCGQKNWLGTKSKCKRGYFDDKGAVVKVTWTHAWHLLCSRNTASGWPLTPNRQNRTIFFDATLGESSCIINGGKKSLQNCEGVALKTMQSIRFI